MTRDIFIDWESGGIAFDKIEGGESTVDPAGDGEIAYCDDDFIIVDDFTFEDCWLNEDEGGVVDEPLPDETDVSEGEVIDYPADMEDFPVICVLYPCEMMV